MTYLYFSFRAIVALQWTFEHRTFPKKKRILPSSAAPLCHRWDRTLETCAPPGRDRRTARGHLSKSTHRLEMTGGYVPVYHLVMTCYDIHSLPWKINPHAIKNGVYHLFSIRAMAYNGELLVITRGYLQ